jgi:hypothetical protein
METELGNPIEYNPQLLDKEVQDNTEPIQDHMPTNMNGQEYYYHPPQPPYIMTPEPFSQKSTDIFASLDKVAYIVIFVAFILGFFMGKTLQPVILRTG